MSMCYAIFMHGSSGKVRAKKWAIRGTKRIPMPIAALSGQRSNANCVKNYQRGRLLSAIAVFGDNLYHLLMQAPLKGKTVLGLDPAFRTGCKLAVVDPTGKFLAKAVIYPHEKS